MKVGNELVNRTHEAQNLATIGRNMDGRDGDERPFVFVIRSEIA